MLAHIWNDTGTTFRREEPRTPVCGQDFCEECGDCLYCNGGDPCVVTESDHVFIVYEADEPGEENC